MPKILGDRVIILIDMDCFFCQVEEKLDPELKGKPIAVVQYDRWKGGGIIAVNYLARAMGVTRHMRGKEAKEKCPDIRLPQVPCSRNKADTSKYRAAGKEVAQVLQTFTSLVERASVDEAYLDITQLVEEEIRTNISNENLKDTFVIGHDDVDHFAAALNSEDTPDLELDIDVLHSQKLLVGAHITAKIRKAVFDATGYTCSAGIAHNKILAKLVCGMNKPNKQTLLPKHSINFLYETLDIKKVKSLGGKFGDTVCDTLKIKKMAELQAFSEKELQHHFNPKHGIWLYNIAHGMDSDPVTPRYVAKSIGCCKKFPGKSALKTLEALSLWLQELAKEIEERLESDTLDNNRIPKQMVVSFAQEIGPRNDVSSSRSYNFLSSDNLSAALFSSKAMELIRSSTDSFLMPNENSDKLSYAIKFLGFSIGKFDDIADNKKTKSIQDLFNAQMEKIKLNPKQPPAATIEKEAPQVTERKNTTPSIKNILLTDQESFFNKFFQQSSSSKSSKCENKAESTEITQEDEESDESASSIDIEINQSKQNIDETQSIERQHKLEEMRTLLKKHEDRIETDEENVEEENEIEFVACEQCHRQIPAQEFLTHIDYHFALKLSKEEKELPHPIPLRKTPETKKTNRKSDPVSISKFFSKPTTISADVPIENCKECGKKVPIEELPQHLDFHEALKIHQQLNFDQKRKMDFDSKGGKIPKLEKSIECYFK